MIPPMVVYKAQHVYEGWTTGGPRGTVYDCTPTGWFDGRTFTRWFLLAFLPAVQQLEGRKVLLGDNLASHFTPEVIRAVRQNDIYFCALPPNATHLMQPLDVSVFGPMKRQWRNILAEWRTETRKKGCFPKEIFPSLMQRLTVAMEPTLADNLKSGFRTSGLHPIDREQVLKKLPSAPVNRERAVGILNAGLIDILERNRGADDQPQRRRGRKVVPGRRLVVDATTGPVASTSTAPVSVASTSTAPISVASTPTAPVTVAYARPVASTPTAPVTVAYARPVASTPPAPVTVAYARPVASTPPAPVTVAYARPVASTLTTLVAVPFERPVASTPTASVSIAPVSAAYSSPVASSSNAYVAPTRASKRAKVTVESADICAIGKDWNSPDPYAESEDAWVGCDTCGRWFHAYCCADENDPCTFC